MATIERTQDDQTQGIVSLTPAAAAKISALLAAEEGVTVVVDPFSAPYLTGATVDYLETIQESGFKIENPNAAASCGCGHSFQAAEGVGADGEAPADGAAGGCGSACSH